MTYCLNPECQKPQNPDTNQICHFCGFPLLLQQRFRPLQLIDRGGMNRTFIALDESQSPAFSCIIKQFSSQNLTPETAPKAQQIFQQEAILLQQLNPHPQIPNLITHFTEHENLYLVQEYIEGMNLNQILEEEGTFNETQIWQLLTEILPVLKFIHQHQIIHRDIKPKNIIRRNIIENPEASNQFVIIDFGAAKLVTENTPIQTGTSIGSPEYIAPEQTKGKAVFASDLYSLGVTCIYLLTGIPPFDLFDAINDCWAWRDYTLNKVSNNLGEILDKLLQNALNRRFRSADEVLETMQKFGIQIKHQPKNLTLKSPIPPLQWQCLKTLTNPAGVLANINTIAIKDNILASGSEDKNIYLWNIETGTINNILTGHSHRINCVAFNPDGNILASCSDDKTIKLWNLQQEISTLSGHLQAVKSIAFSPDGKLLASGSWDKTIKLWDVNTGKEIYTLTGHSLQITCVAFSPCGNFLASASFDRSIRLWDLKRFSPEFRPQLHYTFISHLWSVFVVTFSPDGNILASGSDDKTIKLWDIKTGENISTILGHSWSVVALAFTPNSENLVSGSWDKTIKLWDINTGKEIASLAGHLNSISAVAIDSSGKIIASGSKDKTIKLWYFMK